MSQDEVKAILPELGREATAQEILEIHKTKKYAPCSLRTIQNSLLNLRRRWDEVYINSDYRPQKYGLTKWKDQRRS